MPKQVQRPEPKQEPRERDDYGRRLLQCGSRERWQWFLSTGRAAVIARAKGDEYVIKA